MTPHSGTERSDATCSLWLHSLLDLPVPERLDCLSPAEFQRAARFVFDRDRRRFLASRCALRERLARHTGMAASRLPIANDANGKPFLVGMTGCHFNVSHSEDWALVAIDVAGEVGVDIEMLRSIDGALGLAQSHFTTEELGTFVTLCDDVRDAAFLRAWTRKEACLKAIGTGLRVAPNTVATGLGAETMCVPFELATGRVLVDVRSIELRADCIAAVARVRGTLAPSSLVLRCGEPM